MLGRAQVAGGQLGVLGVHPSSKALPQEKMTPRKKNPAVGYIFGYLWTRVCNLPSTLVSHYRNYTFDVKRSSAQVVLVHNQVCECFVTCHGDAQLVGQLPCAYSAIFHIQFDETYLGMARCDAPKHATAEMFVQYPNLCKVYTCVSHNIHMLA